MCTGNINNYPRQRNKKKLNRCPYHIMSFRTKSVIWVKIFWTKTSQLSELLLLEYLLKATDVHSCSQLITLVRYVNDAAVKEDFLFCKDLKTNTCKRCDAVGERLLSQIWFRYQSLVLCALTGHLQCWEINLAFLQWWKNEIPDLQITWCLLHQHALASKTLLPNLKKVLNNCVIINWIRGCALNHHIFKSFCEDLGVSNRFCFST